MQGQAELKAALMLARELALELMQHCPDHDDIHKRQVEEIDAQLAQLGE